MEIYTIPQYAVVIFAIITLLPVTSQDTPTHDICSADGSDLFCPLEGAHGFVTSPNFTQPQSSGTHDCMCRLTPSTGLVRVTFWTVSLNPHDSGDTPDSIQVVGSGIPTANETGPITEIGASVRIYVIAGETVTFQYTTSQPDAAADYQGFLLEYEVISEDGTRIDASVEEEDEEEGTTMTPGDNMQDGESPDDSSDELSAGQIAMIVVLISMLLLLVFVGCAWPSKDEEDSDIVKNT